MGWICAIPFLAVACQKSPGAFEQEAPGDQPAYDQGGTNGQERQGAYGEGGYGPEGTDGRGGTYGGQQGGTDGFGQGRPTADQPMYRPDVPQAVQTLQQDVEQLRAAGEVQHTELAKSLRDFGAALQTLPAAGDTLTDAVSRINSYADRIEAAGATSNMQTRWAKRALNDGLDALQNYQQERGYTAMAERVPQIRDQVDRINADQPFAEQKDGYVNALEQISGFVAELAAPRQQPGTE